MRELAAGFNFVRHELIKRGDTISQSKQQTMTRVTPPALHFLRVFLAATAALEVQMFVCLSVCLSHLLQLYWTSEGLWFLRSKKFTSLQVAAPRSSRLVHLQPAPTATSPEVD